MNLHALAGPICAIINPWVTATIEKSNGYTTLPDGSRVPSYDSPVPVDVQKQPMTYTDLVQTEGINIQGEKCALYITGNYDGIVRQDGTGGDLITLPSGSKWLVVMVLENWAEQDGWVKVAAVRQM